MTNDSSNADLALLADAMDSVHILIVHGFVPQQSIMQHLYGFVFAAALC